MRVMLSLVFAFATMASAAFADATLDFGDVNGDGVVNASGDGAAWSAGLATDLVGAGQVLVKYNSGTGQILLSSNNIGFIEFGSTANLLVPANAPATIPGSGFSDPFTTSVINYLSFGTLGTGGIFNDFNMGNILTSGLGPLTFVVGPNPLSPMTVRWTVPGQGEFIGHMAVPEPSSIALAGLAGVALVFVARRRRSK
jgi:hypothetical protein